MKLLSSLSLSFLASISIAQAQITVLRMDDTLGGYTTSTDSPVDLADAPVNGVPAIGADDDLWGFAADASNGQSQLGGGDTARLFNYVWGYRRDVGDAQNAGSLTTQLSGLNSAETYNIYGYIITHDNGGWNIQFGLNGIGLTNYTNGSGFTEQEASTINLERVLVGQVTGSTTATINIRDGAGRSFLKGVGVEVVGSSDSSGSLANQFIHGEGHEIAAIWKSATVAATIEAMKLSYGVGVNELLTEPGCVSLDFSPAQSDTPLYATLDIRADGAFIGRITNNSIDKTGESLYFSVLLKIPSEATTSSFGFFSLSSSPGAGNWDSTEILRVGKLSGQNNFAFNAPASGTTHVSSISIDGNSHLLVGRIDFNAGDTDLLTVWLDPQISLGESAGAQVSPLGTASGDFAFRGYQFRGNTPFKADEVRIGDTWTSVLPQKDSDQDGLADEWELTYWPDLSANSGVDSDGDGKSNQAEYESGTDPLNPDSKLEADFSQDTGANYLGWYSAPERFYRVQKSSNLVDWFDLSDNIMGDGTEAAFLLPAFSDARYFYRVKADLDPIPSTPNP